MIRWSNKAKYQLIDIRNQLSKLSFTGNNLTKVSQDMLDILTLSFKVISVFNYKEGTYTTPIRVISIKPYEVDSHLVPYQFKVDLLIDDIPLTLEIMPTHDNTYSISPTIQKFVLDGYSKDNYIDFAKCICDTFNLAFFRNFKEYLEYQDSPYCLQVVEIN